MKTYWFYTKTGKLWRFYWVEGLTGKARKRMYKQRRHLLKENNLFDSPPTLESGGAK